MYSNCGASTLAPLGLGLVPLGLALVPLGLALVPLGLLCFLVLLVSH